MSIIITNDIEQECSNLISMYTDTKYVKSRVLIAYPGLSPSKQSSVPKKIKSHIDQANSFLCESDDNILTAPLTLFYAIHNFTKAIFLVNFPNLSLSNSHGLDFDNDIAANSSELGAISCKITKKGAFTNLISVTKDDLQTGDTFLLKDVFSVIPELREVFFARYFEEPNLYLLREKKNTSSKYKPILQAGITNDIRTRDFSLTLSNSFHFELSGMEPYVWVDANFTPDKFKNVIYQDVYGNKYLTNAVAVNGRQVKLSKIVSLYICYYSFSMLVRYYPEKWSDFCQSSDVSIIRKLLINCRREMMVEVLQLLTGENYTFATKMEQDDADMDSSKLFKEVMKEAKNYSKQIGKNPFMF